MEFFKKYKKDIIVLSVIFVMGLALLLVFVFAKQGGTVVVTVSGTEIARFPLNEDRTYEIEGKDGGINTLLIEDGHVSMIESSCPDALCVNMGKIHTAGQSIICLPNEVVVSIEKGTSETDSPDIILH